MSVLDLLSWWTWLVGAVGILGAIGLLIVLPGFSIGASTIIGRGLAEFGVTILKSRLGLALVVAAVVWIAASVHTAHVASNECTAKIETLREQAKKARADRDAEIAADIKSKYEPELNALKKREGELQQEVASYDKKIAAAKAPQCKLGADALRLRQRKKG